MQTTKLANQPRTAVIIVALIGVTLSLISFLATQGWQSDRQQASFEKAANDRIVALTTSLEADLEVLPSLAAFYAASDNVARDEFATFTKSALSRHPEIQALEWIPWVKSSERATYEAAAHADGHSGFRITQRNADGNMVEAVERANYYPVYFVEPLVGNETAFGFDLGSSKTRLEALHRTRDSGQMVASARITLVQETARQFGFLAFIPIYRAGAAIETIRDRRANLIGFGLGVFRIGDLVQKAFARTGGTRPDIDFVVTDRSAAPEHQFLFSTTPELTRADSAASHFFTSSNLDVAGRS